MTGQATPPGPTAHEGEPRGMTAATRIDTDDSTLPVVIDAYEGADHWPRCACGNDPSRAGFYPVDETGRQVEPTPELWKVSLLWCNGTGCGLVIDQDRLDPVALTYPVVGRVVPRDTTAVITGQGDDGVAPDEDGRP